MINFYDLSPLGFIFLKLWVLLLCSGSLFSMFYAFSLKRNLYTGISALLFFFCYLIQQQCMLISKQLNGIEENVGYLTHMHLLGLLRHENFMLKIERVSVPWFIVLLSVLTAGIVLLLVRNVRFSRKHITPSTIQYCSDHMPCGICYYKDGGKVIFSNRLMNRICLSVTGEALANGEYFFREIPGFIVRDGDKIWKFTHRRFDFQGEPLYELICTDVTEIYVLTEALRKDNEKLSKMKKELNDYYLTIDEAVRNQEILQTKINIHDEMNRLMLSTVSESVKNPEDMNQLFRMWQKNALLLCREGGGAHGENYEKELREVADALGIRLIFETPVPGELTGNRGELFCSAVQEALANAKKHADAETMRVCIEKREERIRCLMTNDGTLPEKEVIFRGGLANLRRLGATMNAEVRVETDVLFKLILEFYQGLEE